MVARTLPRIHRALFGVPQRGAAGAGRPRAGAAGRAQSAHRISSDPVVARALRRASQLSKLRRHRPRARSGEPVLTYSWRVEEQRRPLAVLALAFRFEDELRDIFGKLRAREDRLDSVRAARWPAPRDRQQRSLAACRWVHRLPAASEPGGGVVRFAGREVPRGDPRHLRLPRLHGSPGAGPRRPCLLPLEQAFGQQGSSATASVEAEAARRCASRRRYFLPEMRAIPKRADRIQRDLEPLGVERQPTPEPARPRGG